MTMDDDLAAARKRYEELELKVTKRDARRLKDFGKLFGVEFAGMPDRQFKAYMHVLYELTRPLLEQAKTGGLTVDDAVKEYLDKQADAKAKSGNGNKAESGNGNPFAK